MHLHLDVVGGVAGDMFAAMLLDTWPYLEKDLKAAIDQAGLGQLVSIARKDFDDGVLTGSQVSVDPSTDEAHHHRSWADIQKLLNDADMSASVRARALAIFTLLAEAESDVHGKPIAEVAFHEVGAWDSIADVVMAAWLIDHVGDATWSCSSLPAGRGMVNTVHGRLPVPTPATAYLIRGMPVFTDDVMGDRITPTGAAILHHLSPDFQSNIKNHVLGEIGTGFGTSRFKGISNMLRLTVYQPRTANSSNVITEQVVRLEFEVDDQTPEDLAIALEQLRSTSGVIDAIQKPVTGKKGRMLAQVQLLVEPPHKSQIIDDCFRQTPTLGVRSELIDRHVLAREHNEHKSNGVSYRVKTATRPDANVTIKAEMDDISRHAASFTERQQLRREIETLTDNEPDES